MKYVVILGDGMADLPVPELKGKTPLEVAEKPNMDALAQSGIVGLAQTVPEGMPPGSDTANLAVMGYDPQVYYSGRSPLEAVSMGIPLLEDDVTFRCNLVTLSDAPDYEKATMLDYSSDEITTEEATALISFLGKHLDAKDRKLYPGISYRHCLVLHHAVTGTPCTPPHDITEKPIQPYLPQGKYKSLLREMMRKSYALLQDHPVNLARVQKGLRPANSCWFWGEGVRPQLTSFEALYGVTGGVISAVDLIKGIGICAGLKSVDVPGATGTVHTNFRGKAEAALALLRERDLVYLHMEAPDECGHRHEVANKVKSIELIDREVVGRIHEALERQAEPYAILLMPDHPTPLTLRTHTSAPVPFVLYRSDQKGEAPAKTYTEESAKATGIYVPEGWTLMQKLIQGWKR